jgi:hypothetical protein
MSKVVEIFWMLFCVFVIATMLVTIRREINEIKTLQGFQQETLERILILQKCRNGE